MRSFGFLALAAWSLFNSLFGTAPGVPLGSWFRGGLVRSGIMIALAAWALWVIVSAKPRTATETRG